VGPRRVLELRQRDGRGGLSARRDPPGHRERRGGRAVHRRCDGRRQGRAPGERVAPHLRPRQHAHRGRLPLPGPGPRRARAGALRLPAPVARIRAAFPPSSHRTDRPMSLRHSLVLRALAAVTLCALFALIAPLPAAPQAPASAAASGAPAPVATTTKETIDNPYGLSALWAQGDFVAKGTLIILVIMSMGSWYILVTKLYESLRISGEARAARKGFFRHASLGDA